MNSILLLLSALAALLALAGAQQKYTDRFDNIDVDVILRDDAKLRQYIACALEEGPCSKEGELLKRVLPEALRSQCARCTARQRQNADRVARHLAQHKPQEWARLMRKYDPTGEYRRRYETQRSG